ncbi:unnamed protein product, partial [Prorocentrum cordatum]
DYTTLTLNCHQRNNCMQTLNCHLYLSFDMSGTLATNDLIFNFQPAARTPTYAPSSCTEASSVFDSLLRISHHGRTEQVNTNAGKQGADDYGLGRRSRHLYTDNAIGRYHASDETEFGRFIHDQLLTHQLTAINTHIGVGNTYYGPNKARSRIDYFIGYDNLMEIVKYVKLNWKIHT